MERKNDNNRKRVVYWVVIAIRARSRAEEWTLVR